MKNIDFDNVDETESISFYLEDKNILHVGIYNRQYADFYLSKEQYIKLYEYLNNIIQSWTYDNLNNQKH